MNMKLGLIGGAFNPIHLAHLRIAEVAREAAGLSQVLFIPTADPPHKPLAGEMAFDIRHEMVCQAVADHPSFMVSDIEARRRGKSYTVETLIAMQQERPDDELHFIIGSDSYLELGLWHRFTELFKLASLVVVTRPGSLIREPLQQLPCEVSDQFQQVSRTMLQHHTGTSISFVEDCHLAISSSQVRDLVTAGRSLRYLVPPNVASYIAQKGLYRT